MFDYTKTALHHTLGKMKQALYVFNIVTQIIYIGYLVYATFAKTGLLFAANLILLLLSAAYFVFFLVTTSFGKTPEGKIYRKTGKKIYKWSKRLVKLLPLGLSVYDLCANPSSASPVSVLFVALMAITWILQILFDVLMKIVENEVGYILEAVKLDFEPISKPVGAIGNFIKKVKGEEAAPKAPPTPVQLKRREKLREQVQAIKEEKQRKKEAAKEAKAERQRADKEQAKREKQSARVERKLLRSADKREKNELKRLPTAENGRPALPEARETPNTADAENFSGSETAVELATTENKEEKPAERKKLFQRKNSR